MCPGSPQEESARVICLFIGRKHTFFIHRYEMLTNIFKVNSCNGIGLIKYPAYSSDIMANYTFFSPVAVKKQIMASGQFKVLQVNNLGVQENYFLF